MNIQVQPTYRGDIGLSVGLEIGPRVAPRMEVSAIAAVRGRVFNELQGRAPDFPSGVAAILTKGVIGRLFCDGGRGRSNLIRRTGTKKEADKVPQLDVHCSNGTCLRKR